MKLKSAKSYLKSKSIHIHQPLWITSYYFWCSIFYLGGLLGVFLCIIFLRFQKIYICLLFFFINHWTIRMFWHLTVKLLSITQQLHKTPILSITNITVNIILSACCRCIICAFKNAMYSKHNVILVKGSRVLYYRVMLFLF